MAYQETLFSSCGSDQAGIFVTTPLALNNLFKKINSLHFLQEELETEAYVSEVQHSEWHTSC